MGNVLWRSDTPHFVDFDDCAMGPGIQIYGCYSAVSVASKLVSWQSFWMPTTTFMIFPRRR